MRDGPARWRAGFAAVVLLGVLLRVVLAIGAAPEELSDAHEYRVLATGLLWRGEYGSLGDADWNRDLELRAYRPPGYPFVRAGLMAVFGESPAPALWLNVLCEAVALGLVMLAARRLVGTRGALLAGVVYATFVLFTLSLTTESLSMALWAALTWALVTRAHVASGRLALGVGAVLAVAILVRPVAAFWVPVLAWPLVSREPRAQAARLATLLAPTLVLVGAWTLRNAMLFGSFVWISTNLGVHNAPDFGIPWEHLVELRNQGLSEPDADRALVAEILDAARADPERTLLLYRTRLADLFSVTSDNCWELAFVRERICMRSELSTAIIDEAVGLWRLLHVVGMLGLVRAALTRASSRVLIAPFVLFVLVQCLLSRGDVRLLAPAIPMLCIFAGQALRDPAGRPVASA